MLSKDLYKQIWFDYFDSVLNDLWPQWLLRVLVLFGLVTPGGYDSIEISETNFLVYLNGKCSVAGTQVMYRTLQMCG